jgi:ribosomal protein S18 acetylase RimI-like enzyme
MLDLFLEEKYPKEITLKNNSKAVLRPLQRQDFEKLYTFFRRIPAQERLYLKNDVSNPHVVRGWVEKIDYWERLPLVVEQGDKFIAYASLYQNPFGWMRSIGQMRIIVLPEYRSQGLGKKLIEDIIAAATYSGLEKVDLELVAEQDSAPFQKMGFELQARLKDHVKDFSGKVHDYLILVYNILDPDEEIPGR